MIEPSKEKSEGVLEEIKVVLVWVYNTCTLFVRLTETKFISWTKSIQDIISKEETKAKTLETLIVRLNHTSSIIPLAIYFLCKNQVLSLKDECLCLVPITAQHL